MATGGTGAGDTRTGDTATGELDVEAVLAALTLEEKAALSIGGDVWHTAAVDRLGIESIMVSDGPHGLRAQFATGDQVGMGDSVPATCFPTASAIASSWNVDLVHRVGAAIGREALRWQVSVVLGPGVNMKRSPLCGRNFEYLSEDPYLAGVLASSMVQGIQSQGVGTSLKHFAANNQETDRMRVNAEVDQRTLREIYLPAFEHVVKQAEPWTVMCSYNKVNGTYASQHHWLLTELLRDVWGYDGLVVSDWGAVHDRPAALAAGLDLEMPPQLGYSDVAVVEAVRSGSLPEADLDRTVRRVLRLVAKSRPARQAEHTFDEDDHHALAREAARQSAVLLKNDGGLLPIGAGVQRILVVGEFAVQPRFQGAGSSQVHPTKIDTALWELNDLAGKETVEFVPGFSLDDAAADAGLRAEAVSAAAQADVVIVFLGLPDASESEGFDRTHIDLPDNQLALLAALHDHRDKIAVVLANGSAVATSGWQDHAAAILECWLSGQAAGGAVADLLLGKANPSGKLAETIPVRLQDNSSYLNFPGGDGVVRYGEGVFIGYRGYDALDREVSFPFGHGLSYTSFEISPPTVEVTGSVGTDDLVVTVSATVTNVGDRAGAEVVQAYVGDAESIVARPVRELKGFARVELQPGESQEVTILLNERAFAFWSERLGRWAVEAGEFVISVGSSSRDLAGSETITIDAPPVTGPLDRDSTMAEWLAVPAAKALITADPRIAGALEAMDGPMLAMFGDMPASTVAGFGFLGFDSAALDVMINKLSESDAVLKETDV